jgi:hypothetical protein
VLDHVSDCIQVRGVPNDIARATWLKDASSVGLGQGEREATLTLAPSQRDPFSTVVKLEP